MIAPMLVVGGAGADKKKKFGEKDKKLGTSLDDPLPAFHFGSIVCMYICRCVGV